MLFRQLLMLWLRVSNTRGSWMSISTKQGGGIWTIEVECIWIHNAIVVMVVIVVVINPPLISIIFLERVSNSMAICLQTRPWDHTGPQGQ
jgi:hypothetical protein